MRAWGCGMAELGAEELQALIPQWQERFCDSSPSALLEFFLGEFGNRIALASSMGPEDQMLTDLIMGIDRSARIFTIDTGRLYPETYNLIDYTCEYYGCRIEVFSPDHAGVEAYVRQYGINGFYLGVEQRRACCQARKLEPLRRALSTLQAWICGLRREQGVTRSQEQRIEWDAQHGLLKLNPLVEMTQDEVWEYLRSHHVPYNQLHDRQNFPSIGCAPCTRAIRPGEDQRAGRWWWEDPQHRECGLHRR